MTPVRRCLRKVDAAALADRDLVGRVCEALDELERAYPRPSERIVALEAVLQEYDRRRQSGGTPFGRFLRVSVDRRQNRCARRLGEAAGAEGRPARDRERGGAAPGHRNRHGAADAPVTYA